MTFRDLFAYARARKKYHLIPALVILILFDGMLSAEAHRLSNWL